MTGLFSTECRDGVSQVATAVFDTMFGMAVREVREPAAKLEVEFTAAVYYAGEWKGALVLDCTRAQAMDWAARLMSLTPPVTIEDARDGLGELANMLAGNLKPLVPRGVGISMPCVVQGSDYSLRMCGGERVESLYFTDELGSFRITLVEVVDG